LLDLSLAFAGSFVAGYLGAAVGLVLGTLRLPLVLLLAGSPSSAAGTNIAISAAAAASGGWEHARAGTNVAVSAAAALVGGARHARAGRVDWRVVAWMAPPSIAGAVLGGLTGHLVPEEVLLAGVAAVLAWNGSDLLLSPFREAPEAEPRLTPAVGLGFVIGLIGGALGVILGTLRMPALLRAVHLSAHRAVGTNLVVGFLLGVFGFAAHAARLEVEWGILAAGLVGAIPGAILGARATGRLSELALRRALGVALLVIAASFVVELIVRL
jgi:uncharacterized membrane protein YfcA